MSITRRSNALDLEATALVISDDAEYQQGLKDELEWLRSRTEKVTMQDFDAKERKVALDVKIGVCLLGDKLSMGASDSKLAFRRGVFRLYEERNIPADDEYWTQFWQLPETASDVFTLFSTADLRRVRDTAPENLDNLILALCNHLFELRQHPQFPHPELAPAKEALNCMRVLTRIFPFVYEKAELEEWEEKFWWGPRRGAVSRANSMAASETADGGAEPQRTPSSRSWSTQSR
ncbi:hypothetical protein SAICODRAFT_6402 [Saitoella complicata NRRL Y-17804]|uniref:uncharacterized protein n=1 Tax=Saitoella complicata (strain BCRC 22490 / CBS 7301 / JCM 7358 / NBRC 10748 / NRRL Y-17804) TaxID=698492 RepID=UPI0008676F29|nr:uncharacterized protein SAICODRAFT_6402 [Saitoella complicata NRRL Y-17804]ODQ54107.1 hypothetical protein SAICODRAFT_6402 [Saitoella complicata NRRL Y-17804]